MWELIGTAQILSLFLLINLKLMPISLTDFAKSLGPALFSIIPNAITLLVTPDISHANDPSNSLTDNLWYHPNLNNRDLLLNIGNLITLYILIGLSYPMFLFLSYKFPMFSKYLVKYKWNVFLRTVMVTFFQLFLVVVVHFKYVRYIAFNTNR